MLGLAGSLLGRKSAKKQAQQQYDNELAAMHQQREWDLEDRDEARAYSRDVYKNLVIDAEAAGFNPLTALRNGGGANYNAAAGMAPLSRKAPVQQAVGGSPIGDAFTSMGNFLQNFDPFADQKREQEYRLIESQIASLNAGTLSRSTPSAVRSYGTSDYESRPSGKAAALGKPSKWEPGDVTVTNPFQKMEVDPNVADAAAWEERYGDSEIGSMLYGAYIYGADWLHNFKRNAGNAWKAKPQYSRHLIRKPRSVGGGGGW